MTKCPACRRDLPSRGFEALAEHLLAASRESDPAHVRWLNQSIGLKRLEAPELSERLTTLFRLPSEGLGEWVRRRFAARFFGPRPHPFVAALQHPTRSTLLGYVVEHQHFLRGWGRSCALILARTDRLDVTRYEIENLSTELGGAREGGTSHYELLLRMGEALGLSREEVLAVEPLPTTRRALAEWREICEQEPWVAAMAAMHGLELIADRTLREHGATLSYFDPAILSDGSVPPAAAAFLREGYEADAGHAGRALSLVERYARELDLVEAVQGTFLRSMDLFDDYLGARLERGERYGSPP